MNLGASTIGKRLLSPRARRYLFAKYGNLFGRKTLYHVTPSERASSIMQQGLRESAPKNWREPVRSNTPGIFLGNFAGAGFMRGAGPLMQIVRGGQSKHAFTKPHTLFKVKVKRSRLLSDPDWGPSAPLLPQAYRVRGRIAAKNVRRTTFERELGKRAAVGATATTAVVGYKRKKNTQHVQRVRRV